MKNHSAYRQVVEVRVAVQELEEKLQDITQAFLFLKNQQERLEKVIEEERDEGDKRSPTDM